MIFGFAVIASSLVAGGLLWRDADISPENRQDCPLVPVTVGARVTQAVGVVTATVSRATSADVFATLDGRAGRCLLSSDEGRVSFAFDPPVGGWKPGLTRCAFVAEGGPGTRTRRAFWVLNAPKPKSAIAVGSDGRFRENGRTIFPLGIYCVEEKYLAEVRSNGFDVVQNYDLSSFDAVSCRRYLDACWAADGLRALVGFADGTGGTDGIVQGDLDGVADRVAQCCTHPALHGWYLFDEPWQRKKQVSPARLRTCADLVRALDPWHPVLVTHCKEGMGDYRACWDSHMTQAYGYPKGVFEKIDGNRAWIDGDPAVTLIVCGMDIQQSKKRRQGIAPNPDRYSRNYDFIRACAFASVVCNCNGLWMWKFARESVRDFTAAQVPRIWAAVGRIMAELNALKPILNAKGDVATGQARCGEQVVEWWQKTVGGQRTLIAVNSSDRPVEVKLTIPGREPVPVRLGRYGVLNVTDRTPQEDSVRPKYAWRGLMVDEGRFFFGKAAVKETLDRMAACGLNVFHWHLTEDQGWRLEIRRFPELTRIGAVRPASLRVHEKTLTDGTPYGPHFYTQEDVREIVRYAAERKIDVVPEIELPGHVTALLAAHPEFSCTGKVSPTDMISQGVQENVLCAGNDAAIRFMEQVFDGVCELFPGHVIHIGGDECPKTRWKECPKCQARIRALGLRNEDELQAWITRHFADYLMSKGRRVMAWDEVLEGEGCPTNLIVQCWHRAGKGRKGGEPLAVQAARRGFDVVQSPLAQTYFSLPHGPDDAGVYRRSVPTYASFISIDDVRAFRPAADFPENLKHKLLGAECCCWSENTRTPESLNQKTWPRAEFFCEALGKDKLTH